MSLPPQFTNSLDYYRLLRSQLEHEDDLITNRLNWFLTSQSFLFTAYAILANGLVPGTTSAPDARHQLLVIIPLISGVSCLLIFVAILSGIWAIRNLVCLYHLHVKPEEAQQLPPLQGRWVTQFFGLVAPVLLPLLFMGVWIFLLMKRLF